MKTALIITTYNWPDALELVLESVKIQTVLPDEVIIADDGSNEDTRLLIQKFQKKFPTKLKHIWQEDKGFRAAMSRNRAIANSESDYIIGIDGDIILHPKFIEDHKNNAKKNRYIQGKRVLLTKEKSKEVLELKKIKFSFFENGLKNRKNALHSNFLKNIFSKINNSLKGVKSCNFSLFKEDLLKINGFDNSFIGWGREDSEMVARFLNNNGERFDLMFNAIGYHLYHKENKREFLEENELKLKETIKNKKTWCENGIDSFLKSSL